jgi:hypothetical protein
LAEPTYTPSAIRFPPLLAAEYNSRPCVAVIGTVPLATSMPILAAARKNKNRLYLQPFCRVEKPRGVGRNVSPASFCPCD